MDIHIFKKKNIKGKNILQYAFPHLTIKWGEAEGRDGRLMLKTEQQGLGIEARGDPAVILTRKQRSLIFFVSTCTDCLDSCTVCSDNLNWYIEKNLKKMRPCEDVGAMVCSMVAGHEGDLGPRSVQPQVPHGVRVSVYPMMSSVTATGHCGGGQ